MRLSDLASVFGRHEFLIRRLHSLLGLIPIGGYLAFHLATNGAIIDGLPAYQHRADQIHKLGPTTILILEWSLIFLPILFHGLIGMLIVTRGKRNIVNYPYEGNVRYTLQRATGGIAFVFILWHVFQMHGWLRAGWWVEYVARPLGGAQFEPEHAHTAAQVIQSSWIMPLLYAVGTLACVYHLANGIWTMGITWGAWTSPRAQRWAKFPCAVVGILLAVVGMGALWGMLRAEVPPAKTNAAPATGQAQGLMIEDCRLMIDDWRSQPRPPKGYPERSRPQSTVCNHQSSIINLQSSIPISFTTKGTFPDA